jgi:hypothetical protein
MRDDFPEMVKRVLALRVRNECSNPDCRAPTSGPQIDGAKALNIGVAAHITAAAVGGPRYNPSLTSEERCHPNNGIWLCQTCGKLVDHDALQFPDDLLRAWKTLAEDRALRSIGKTVAFSGSDSRGSRIHERQVEALLTIYSKLEYALFYLRRAASPGKIQGEADDQELLLRMGRDLAAASEVFSQNRLLIGPELTRKVDEFVKQAVEAGTTLNLAGSPMTPNGQIRAGFYDKARDIAFEKLPPVLEAIGAEAKAVIHG